MIHIVKGPAPSVLTSRGPTEVRKLAAAVRSKTKLTFRKSLYAAKPVKDELVKAQHGKCAFCESHFLHVGYGDVEHFRPKAGSRQTPGGKLLRPGYFWLAYDWNNLFLSCQLCNQKFKENLFPLRDPSKRCRKPSHPLTRERPLLVHPELDDPEAFVSFRGETASAVHGGGAVRGNATITTFGLNRDELKGKRMEVLERLRMMKEMRDTLSARLQRTSTPDPDDHQHFTKLSHLLADAQLPSAEYSAMARAFLR
jgi:uncharacterized protein (TIGR02646 family)